MRFRNSNHWKLILEFIECTFKTILDSFIDWDVVIELIFTYSSFYISETIMGSICWLIRTSLLGCQCSFNDSVVDTSSLVSGSMAFC
jgi:hypothetical protein